MKLLSLFLGFMLVGSHACANEIHVSTQGNDAATGNASNPVATLSTARDKARIYRSERPDEPIEIIVHDGTYILREALNLTTEDSGSVSAPTTYRAAMGEHVILTGATSLTPISGTQVASLDLLPVSTRENVLVFQLDDTIALSSLLAPNRSQDVPMSPDGASLIYRGSAQPRASTPNNVWASFHSEDSTENLQTSVPGFQGMMHAFSTRNDQDRYESLSNALASMEEGARYKIENRVEDLDRPGEWVIDVDNRQLLWWPPNTGKLETPELSTTECLISLYGVKNVSIDGFVIEGARDQAIEIAGGSNCTVRNCVVRCIGNTGASVFHGIGHSITGCEFYDTGASAIRIEGGDAADEKEAGHSCSFNRIHACCSHYQARRGAIEVYGYGVSVNNNRIENLPDWAIYVDGSKNQIQENELHHVCLETEDTGAIYMTLDTKQTGNLVSSNFIHDIGKLDGKNTFAIYLDDYTSNTVVSNNIIQNSPRGIVIRNGSYNSISNNAILQGVVGIQIGSNAGVENKITSNAITADNPIVLANEISKIKVVNNTKRIDELFVDPMHGDFRIANQELASLLSIRAISTNYIGATPSMEKEVYVTSTAE
ncbi:MAG: right-handed parallel beta-helix repeat-containing protein [Pirellula sp.]|jgi:parallel beta-helix repeat protein|nr:right-handed parallel beta-helix repeat-containing protein [Pirellula sp.]